MDILKAIWNLFLFFVPRFVTEDVAVEQRPDGDYDIICSASDVQPGELPDGVVAVRSFVFMFWAWPVGYEEREEMDVRPWSKD